MKKYYLEKSEKVYPVITDKIRNVYLTQTFDIIETSDTNAPVRRDAEKALLDYISLGNLNLAETLVEELLSGDFMYPVGLMSEHALHQARYAIVASVTLFSRQAIDSGLPEHLAYSISDAFIQYADHSQNIDEINFLFFQAFLEFCRAMEDWRLKDIRSEIRRCCGYIACHLHSKITLDELSRTSNMSSNYLSALFLKELGIRPLEYVRREKLNYAAYIFRNTEANIGEIAALLAFPSASAFSKQFEKQFGVTPKEYKKQSNNKELALLVSAP